MCRCRTTGSRFQAPFLVLEIGWLTRPLPRRRDRRTRFLLTIGHARRVGNPFRKADGRPGTALRTLARGEILRQGGPECSPSPAIHSCIGGAPGRLERFPPCEWGWPERRLLRCRRAVRALRGWERNWSGARCACWCRESATGHGAPPARPPADQFQLARACEVGSPRVGLPGHFTSAKGGRPPPVPRGAAGGTCAAPTQRPDPGCLAANTYRSVPAWLLPRGRSGLFRTNIRWPTRDARFKLPAKNRRAAAERRESDVATGVGLLAAGPGQGKGKLRSWVGALVCLLDTARGRRKSASGTPSPKSPL